MSCNGRQHGLLLPFAYVLALSRASAASLSGIVTVDGEGLSPEQVHVGLFRVNLDVEAGLTKRRLLGADSLQPLRKPPVDLVTHANLQGGSSSPHAWEFSFPSLPSGNYSVVAFEPAGENRGYWLDFAAPRRQALGILHEGDACEASAWGDTICATILELTSSKRISDVHISLQSPHLMPSRPLTVPNGFLRPLDTSSASVLHLRGNAYERGFAHGMLLSQQIIDFFDFFLIEDMVRSKEFYRSKLRPALKQLVSLTPQFEQGILGLLAGMRASNVSMTTCLGRDLDFYDVVAINTYADSAAWTSDGAGSRASRQSACSQFVFWGDAVASSRRGATLAGRNMDGENDIRKLTVNYLLIFAIEPSEEDLQRYVHVMWPGFLGTSSGFNEHGRYIMENAGCNPPGAAAKRSPLIRDVISSLLSDGSLSSDASHEQVESAILTHKSEAGGSCMNGCILMNAAPFKPGKIAGFAYEGDRHGGKMRLPAQVPPVLEQGIMATNHYFGYNSEPGHPDQCNGAKVSFDSLARYFAGQNKIESWLRSQHLRISSNDVKELLRTVAHGTTEHSIIFSPNDKIFELAVASPNGVWDAPYSNWTQFSFEDIFRDGWTFVL